MRQEFGGEWTQKKLEALRKYLEAYMTIMRGNPKAANFRTVYVDGFAGSGKRYVSEPTEDNLVLEGFDEIEQPAEFFEGSVRLALQIKHPFDHYIFVEEKRHSVVELNTLPHEFPTRSIEIVQLDVNKFIPQWCEKLNPMDRALVFLDPYGLQVKWTTIEAIAQTKKIDLWVLIPFGQGILRLLKHNNLPSATWMNRLTDFLGTEEWKQFYRNSASYSLYEDEDEDHSLVRSTDVEGVAQFIVKRYEDIFEKVLAKPFVLRNQKNNPLYLLLFAASNPKGASTAVRIAGDIRKGWIE
ncbi:MAG: three-Cys-motif partner protein TcmP [Fimbriimonadia bacterium]|nr:three-Cys-motif partner protein TcmP [Fimbriimonadia bacterium]